MKFILPIALAACTPGNSGVLVDTDTDETDASDTACPEPGDTDTPAPSDSECPPSPPSSGRWVGQALPTEGDLRAALFIDAVWVFATDPSVALRLEDGVWTDAPHPPGGKVQAAGAFGNTGVVASEDGAFRTWNGAAWETYTDHTMDVRVWRLAVGSLGELYVYTGGALHVLYDGSVTVHELWLDDLVALPEGGVAFADGGISRVTPDSPPQSLGSRGGLEALCVAETDALWASGNDLDEGPLQGRFDGTAWTWEDCGDGRTTETYGGMWCTPWGSAVTGYFGGIGLGPINPPVSSRTFHTSVIGGDLARSTPIEDVECGYSFSRLFEIPPPADWERPCFVEGRGEVGLVLGRSGNLHMWVP